MRTSRKYIYIVGPTCTGKTRLSIAVSQKWSQEAETQVPIVNADSIQVYQGVEVGTAKPSLEELSLAPHKMFDVVPVGEAYSVANYLNDTVKVVDTEKLDTALICGGSGFYIQALEKGLYPDIETSAAAKEQVFQWIGEHGFDEAYKKLASEDPSYANAIHPNDHYRIRRGLEILLSHDGTVTSLKKAMETKAKSPLPAHHAQSIGLFFERSEQSAIVHQRTLKMLDAGWIEEVESFVKRGLRDWAPIKSVGYKEIVQYLDGDLSKDELPQKITTATLQLIKKQTTWFKKNTNIQWFHANAWHSAEEKCLDFFRAPLP